MSVTPKFSCAPLPATPISGNIHPPLDPPLDPPLLFYYRSLRLLIVYVRRHRFMKFLAILLVLLILFKILEPNYFSYTISYFRIIINMVNTDIQRHQDVTRQEAEVAVSKNINWKYREGENCDTVQSFGLIDNYLKNTRRTSTF
jgi:hypothetical protein